MQGKLRAASKNFFDIECAWRHISEPGLSVHYKIQWCCVFQPANGCCTLHLLVEILCLMLYLFWTWFASFLIILMQKGGKTQTSKSMVSTLKQICPQADLPSSYKLFHWNFLYWLLHVPTFVHCFGWISLDQPLGANSKKTFFCSILLQICNFFSFYTQKMLKMTILTSVRGAQHPNAGRNIQHLTFLYRNWH